MRELRREAYEHNHPYIGKLGAEVCALAIAVLGVVESILHSLGALFTFTSWSILMDQDWYRYSMENWIEPRFNTSEECLIIAGCSAAQLITNLFSGKEDTWLPKTEERLRSWIQFGFRETPGAG